MSMHHVPLEIQEWTILTQSQFLQILQSSRKEGQNNMMIFFTRGEVDDTMTFCQVCDALS